MSVQELVVPFADVRSDALCWALGLPEREPLAQCSVVSGGLRVELRILGASHQVLVRDGRNGVLLSETVACDLPGAAPMPAHAARPDYEFAATVEQLPGDELAARVQRLEESLAGRPDAVAAAFPGVPHAVTALAMAIDGFGWESWHVYPQTGELVHTTTRVTGEVCR
jgi:hypothetical protein